MRTKVAVGVFVLAALVSAWPSAAQPAPPAGGGAPPLTRIEEFLSRPDRFIVRDVTEVGVIEHERDDATATVRVQTVVVHDMDKPAERVQALAIVVDNTVEPFTVLFDANQIPKLQAVLGRLMTTAAAERVPPRETRRHVVYGMNGLEVAVRAGGADGGYVGRAGLDQPAVRLSTDDFAQLRDLLEQARAALARDAARHAAGKEDGAP